MKVSRIEVHIFPLGGGFSSTVGYLINASISVRSFHCNALDSFSRNNENDKGELVASVYQGTKLM